MVTSDSRNRLAPVAELEVPARALQLERLAEAEIEVNILGMTPLIPHKWSEKSLSQMRERQFGSQVRGKLPPKNPSEEAESSLYRLDDGSPGMPATAFKAAAVGACALFGKEVTKVLTKQVLHVVGEGAGQLVAIKGELLMREDTPRNAGGTVDLRYRYQIWPWSTVLVVRFLPAVLSGESVIALLDAGGRGGVGDWRPSAPKSSTGTYGQFRVAS